MKLRGVIFDLDGTLDTLPICVEAFRRAVKAHSGQDMSRDEIEALFGPTEEGMLQHVLPEYSSAALDTYHAEYELLHTTCTAPFPGIPPLLEELLMRGILLAVVTGKGSVTADITCRALGLGNFFPRIATGSPKGLIKSATIARIITEWSLQPSEVAYVGDARTDIEAARSAGVVSVAAAWAPAAIVEILLSARPDFLFRAVPDFASWVTNAVDAV